MNYYVNPILAHYFSDPSNRSECQNPLCEEHHHSDCPLEELPISYFPDSILKQTCEPVPVVTEEVKQLAKNMLYTMMLGKGIGLAAPQVGIPLRLFVADVGWPRGLQFSEPRVFINPTVVDIGGVSLAEEEGCLSFPGASAKVLRSTMVRVEALDLEGESFIGVLDNPETDYFLARVVQHEYDHLNGITIQKHLSYPELSKARKNIKKALRERGQH